jgi:hypothetical protein
VSKRKNKEIKNRTNILIFYWQSYFAVLE